MAMPQQLSGLFAEEVEDSGDEYFQTVPIGNQVSPEEPQDRLLANALLALGEKEVQDRQRTSIQKADIINTEVNKGTYGNAKIKASVQPNGTVLIEGRGPTTDEILGTTAGLKNNKPFSIATLDDEIKSIANEKDPIARNLMLANLNTSANEFSIGLTENIRTTTYQAAGIPQLEAQLQIQRNSDKIEAIGNGLPPIDSPLTQQMIKTIDQRKVEAEDSIKRALSTNLTYNALAIKMKSIEPLLARQQSLDLARDSALIQKETFAEQQRAAEAAQLPAFAGPRAIALGLAKDTTNLYDKIAGKGITDEDKEAIITRTEDLPLLAFLQNNTAAKKLLLMDEANATDTKVVDTLWANQNQLKKEAMKLAPSKEEKSRIESLFSGTQIDNTKEGKSMRDQEKLRYAMRVVSASKINSFNNDVAKWSTDNPDFKDAVRKVQDAGLQPTRENVFKVYLGDTMDPLQRKAKLAEFSKVALGNVERYNSIYGGVDTNELIATLPLLLLRNTPIKDFLEDSIGSVAGAIGSFAIPGLSGIGGAASFIQGERRLGTNAAEQEDISNDLNRQLGR